MGKDQKTNTDVFLDIERKYSKSFSKIIFALANKDKKITFRVYLKQKSSLADYEKIAKDVLMLVVTRIRAGVEYYSLAQYLYMKLSGSWSDAGEDRVRSGMMHLFLDIPVETDPSFSDYDKAETIIRERVVKYKLQDKTEEQLKKIIKAPVIEVLGKVFEFSQSAEINAILEILESNRRIIMGQSGDYVSMIFGLSNSIKYNQYNIHFFYKEEMRTPNQVYYIVGVIEQTQIAIRREVCEYIFYKKWLPVVDHDLFMSEFFSSNLEMSISESIKKKVCSLFEADSRDRMIEIKDDFVDCMMENFVYHEIAHDALEESNLSKDELAITAALSINEENILSVINEILTEWMPQKLNVFGPMKNILNIAFEQGNQKKANQLLYIYLSDGWFLDTDTEFMYPYTYVMFAVLVKYLHGDEVDFIGLYNDLNDIFNVLSLWFRETLTDVMLEFKKFPYVLNGEKCDFQELQKRISIVLDIADVFSSRDISDDHNLSRLWINVVSQVKVLHPELLKTISELLKVKEQNLYKDLIYKFGGKEKSAKFGSNIKSFVLESMTEIGSVSEKL